MNNCLILQDIKRISLRVNYTVYILVCLFDHRQYNKKSGNTSKLTLSECVIEYIKRLQHVLLLCLFQMQH